MVKSVLLRGDKHDSEGAGWLKFGQLGSLDWVEMFPVAPPMPCTAGSSSSLLSADHVASIDCTEMNWIVIVSFFARGQYQDIVKIPLISTKTFPKNRLY